MDFQRIAQSIEENAKITFARSGGKGGQNVNKVNTKVRACIAASKLEGLSQAELALALSKLKGSLTKEGEIFCAADDTREQEANRKIALKRLATKVAQAARVKPKRVKTKRTAASNEKRLKAKRLRSLVKQMRSSSDHL